MGIRGSYSARQGQAASGDYSSGFGIENARLYFNGQIHKYIKFEFNTECFNCAVGAGGGFFGGNSTIGLLDAIAKFEYNRYVNLWAGRMLVPTSRAELNGPFYHATYEGFKTPFFPQDFSFGFGAPNNGLYGRDNGVTFFGDAEIPQPFGMGNGTVQYAVGVFSGSRSGTGLGANQSDSASWAGRLTYNFLNPEKILVTIPPVLTTVMAVTYLQ